MKKKKRKIGKHPTKGDKYGYYPNIFSACVNRRLARRRLTGDDFAGANDIDKALAYANNVIDRFITLYSLPNNPLEPTKEAPHELEQLDS